MEKFKVLLSLFLCLLPTLGAGQTISRKGFGFRSTLFDQDAELTPETRLKTFDLVWRTVRDKFFDPNLKGLDWLKIRHEYEPRLASIKTDVELNAVLNEMLFQFHLSHLFVISLRDWQRIGGSPGGIGIDVRLINGQAVVTSVDSGSAADRGGLKPGFIVRQVSGVTVEQAASKIEKLYPWSAALARSSLVQAILAGTFGEPGTQVEIAYLDAQDRDKIGTFVREARKGATGRPGYGVPSTYSEADSRTVENGIGYIRFNFFSPANGKKVIAAIKSFGAAPGIIIDVRGNPGGLTDVATDIASSLFDKKVSIGFGKKRKGIEHFDTKPKGDPYIGPVAVLTDGLTGSSSEVFAGGLQDIGRVKIIGETSAGGILDSEVMKLPTGSVFVYAIADYETPSGVVIEGRGVIPDIEVKLTRDALLKGRDPQLEKAVEWIQQQRKGK